MNATPPFSEIRNKKVYFIGIGGIGMSALARWFSSQKWTVYGSDIVESDITKELKKNRIMVKIGQKRANIPERIPLFIYNQAISEENEEFREAKTRKDALILSYAEAVGFLTRYYDTCAIAGSHGKSTTTSLLALALIQGKLDPTVIVGTLVKEFGKKKTEELNFRKGKGNFFVLEADEFHSSFLNYSPLHAIITNIDREHLDWYGNFTNVKRAFLAFIKNIRPNGTLVVNKDDKHLYSLVHEITTIATKKKIVAVWYSLRDAEAKKIIRAIRHVPGTHMQSNAYAAFLLARQLGVKEQDILTAFKAYHGVWRRMEYKGQIKIQNLKSKIDVYDDYGHHPTEIAATLHGAKTFFKKRNIICAFQPHQGKRLQLLFKEFIRAFDDTDALFLFPVYKVPGRDEAKKIVYTSENLSKKIVQRKKIRNVFYLKNFDEMLPWIEVLKKEKQLPYRDSILIMMGAGNINEQTKKIVKKIND